ncbi:MAG: L-threonylcarbamoyladenylate synthase [Roseicyclus sp.]
MLSADAGGIARAVALLGAGGLVAVPTETVYGLAADATDAAAVARIFAAKGRPRFNPLIVHLPDLDAVRAIAEMPEAAEALAGAFWPGPMTLVLPIRAAARLAAPVTAGLPSVAVRLPAHPVMREVLRALGRPLAAPSANPSGRISATTAAHVKDGLGARVDAILDAGPCALGLESTILAPGAGGLRLLREGGLSREAVEAVAGPLTSDVTPGRSGHVEAPGQMERHYAPSVPLRLGGALRAGEVTLGFGPGAADLNLSPGGDLGEAASRLFAVLHEADALARARGAAAIRVAEVPDTGLGRGINDRLRRAAAPATDQA